jgi:hypothetical protein
LRRSLQRFAERKSKCAADGFGEIRARLADQIGFRDFIEKRPPQFDPAGGAGAEAVIVRTTPPRSG